MGRKQKILVVDDDTGTTKLVRAYLEKAGYTVEVANDGQTALKLAKEQTPDLIVLDIMLPDKSGLEICKVIRSESDVPIIMLTARVLEEDRLEGFDTGADDYVTKPFSPRELVSRIQAVIRRCNNDPSLDGPKQLTRGKLSIDFVCREAKIGKNDLKLTPTEFRIFSALMMEPNRVFTRSELVEKAFGQDWESFERTLDVHILHLRRKLKAVDPTADQYINTMYGMGYRLKVGR
jgi:DNA-binding response OmpR family regulator